MGVGWKNLIDTLHDLSILQSSLKLFSIGITEGATVKRFLVVSHDLAGNVVLIDIFAKVEFIHAMVLEIVDVNARSVVDVGVESGARVLC